MQSAWRVTGEPKAAPFERHPLIWQFCLLRGSGSEKSSCFLMFIGALKTALLSAVSV